MMPREFPTAMRFSNLLEFTRKDLARMTQMGPASHVVTLLRNPLAPEPLTRTSWRLEDEVVDAGEVKVEVEDTEGVEV